MQKDEATTTTLTSRRGQRGTGISTRTLRPGDAALTVVTMATFHANYVGVLADIDYGEGRITLQWSDPLFGTDGLSIDLDGHCSRNMAIRSGNGPPEFLELRRDHIRLRFDSVLARKLELDEIVDITFAISEEQFGELQHVIAYFNGDADEL